MEIKKAHKAMQTSSPSAGYSLLNKVAKVQYYILLALLGLVVLVLISPT